MNIYFSGIGGVGIGPLAEIVHDAGYQVQGSDQHDSLMVRELEEDTSEDTRIVLTGTGAGGAERVERALSEAASLALHLLRRGIGVELAGAAGLVGLGRGRGQERRILTALALYPPSDPPVRGGASGSALREIRVSLDTGQ